MTIKRILNDPLGGKGTGRHQRAIIKDIEDNFAEVDVRLSSTETVLTGIFDEATGAADAASNSALDANEAANRAENSATLANGYAVDAANAGAQAGAASATAIAGSVALEAIASQVQTVNSQLVETTTAAASVATNAGVVSATAGSIAALVDGVRNGVVSSIYGNDAAIIDSRDGPLLVSLIDASRLAQVWYTETRQIMRLDLTKTSLTYDPTLSMSLGQLTAINGLTVGIDAVIEEGQRILALPSLTPSAFVMLADELPIFRVNTISKTISVENGYRMTAPNLVDVSTPSPTIDPATNLIVASVTSPLITNGNALSFEEGQRIISLPNLTPSAFVLLANELPVFRVDTFNKVVKIEEGYSFSASNLGLAPPNADYTQAASLAVSRAGRFGYRKWSPPVTDGYVTSPCRIILASEDTTYANPPHNLCPSICRTGNRWWASWNSSLSPSGTFAEVTGSFDVLAYSDDQCQTWTVTAYAVPVNVTTDRSWDPYLFTLDGALYWMYPQCGNSQGWDKQGGIWIVPLWNPEATSKVWEFGRGTFLYDGVPGFPVKVGREVWFTANVWRSTTPRFADRGGKHVMRFHPGGFEGPALERMSTIPDADPAWNTFDETGIIALRGGRMLAIWRTTNPTNAIFRCFSEDGGITWGTPTPFEPPLGTAAPSRCRLARSPSGRLVLIYHQTGRVNATIAFSENEGLTWPYAYVFETEFTSYPDIDFDTLGNCYIIYDRSRGQNPAFIINEIRVCKIPEASVIAGAGTNVKYLAAS